ncbi:helix-turn-helix domain-containing protein [uncultured Williamsia sp.]|uniref:helix-turn-helix domain-containing protein n=1 Tax=uncultured Williamsia sp. TaxID=259311 RepID=UPI002619CCC3|nr:helix-turn-helix domain-containing protein [uncultured Williamsia sp.]
MDKKFYQSGDTSGTALYGVQNLTTDMSVPVLVVEGEKDVNTARFNGFQAVSPPQGASTGAARFDWTPVAGRPVMIVADKDDAGRKHANDVADSLEQIASSVIIVEAAEGKDLTDHLAADLTVDDLRRVTPDIEATHEVFRRWLGDSYDLDVLDIVLSVAASEKLDGDPAWLLVVSGSGNAKTETVQALAGAGARVTSEIKSPGALLSATASKERSKNATGGLLAGMNRGLLIIKDVTTILSMSRDSRAELLAALREIADGYWERNVGSDGGLTLTWKGRLVTIGAVTTAWDKAHAVIAACGDRFLLVRADSTINRKAAGRSALANVGSEKQMRQELSDAVGALFAGLRTSATINLDAEAEELILDAGDLVAQVRTAVEVDRMGTPEMAHAPEAATRIVKQLAQVARGALALGIDRDRAIKLAVRCARDTMPPMRLELIDYLAEHPNSSKADVARGVNKPRASTVRQLQMLQLLGVVEEDDSQERWALSAHIDPKVIDMESMSRNGTTLSISQEGPRQPGVASTSTATSGQTPSMQSDGSTAVSGQPSIWCECGKPADEPSVLCIACQVDDAMSEFTA